MMVLRRGRKIFAILFLTLLIVSVASAEGKPSYRFSGYMFGDYFYNVTRDENASSFVNVTLPGEEDLNGFTLRRIYLTFDDDISPDFTGAVPSGIDCK